MKILGFIAAMLVMSTGGAGAPLGAPLELEDQLIIETIGGTIQKVPALTQDWYETYSIEFAEAMASFPAAPWITSGLDTEETGRIEALPADEARVRMPQSGTVPVIFAGCLGFWGVARRIQRPAEEENRQRARHKVRRERRMMAC
jgi:hypothetical protein